MTWTGEHMSPYPVRRATQAELEWLEHCNQNQLELYNRGRHLFLLTDGCIHMMPSYNAKEVVAKLKKSQPYREGYEIPLNWDERTRVENVVTAIKRAIFDPRNKTISKLYGQIFELEWVIEHSPKNADIDFQPLRNQIKDLQEQAKALRDAIVEQRQQDIDQMRLVG